MAITIHQSPQIHSPGFNDLVYVVSSTNTAQTNFQYLCDIYLTNDSGAISHAGRTYLREKTPVDPLYSSGVFNISNHIRSFLTYDLHGSSGSVMKCPNSNLQVVCKFGEEYGPSSGITQYADLATASTVIVKNQVFDFLDFKDFNYSNYTNPSGNTTAKFLTNVVSTDATTGFRKFTVRDNEDAWLYKMASASNEAMYFNIRTYDNLGSIIATHQIYNAFSAISTVGRYSYQIPAGPLNINLIPENDIVGANVQPIIYSSVYSYDIWSANASNTQTSEKIKFVIDYNCVEDTVYRLFFLNKLGGFDAHSFTLAHTFETNVKREIFKRNMITRIGGGNYGYNKYDSSDVQYLTTNKDTVKVVSNWIDENTSTWLEELVTSPVVYLYDSTHGYVSVNITDSKHVRKQWRRDGLFNIELSFTYGYDRYRQTL